MKRVLFIGLAIVFIFSLVICGCTKPAPTPTPSPAPSPTPAPTPEKTIELKFSYHTPPQASLVSQVFVPWTEGIEQASNGKVKITHYGSASLVSLQDQYDAVVSGLADIAMVEPDVTPGRFPLSEISLLPFLFTSGEQASRVYYDLLNKYCIDTEWNEVKVLMTPALMPMQYQGTKSVHVLEDLKGVKLRTGGTLEGVITQTLGATPVEMDTGEVYNSIERGLVDGCWFSSQAVFSFGIKDVTQYRTICDLFSRGWVIVMNLQTWEGLPDDIKKIIEDNSGVERSAELCANNDKVALESRQGLIGFDKGAGHEGYYTLPADEKARWVEAVEPVYAKWIEDMEARGLPGEEMIEDARTLAKKYAN